MGYKYSYPTYNLAIPTHEPPSNRRIETPTPLPRPVSHLRAGVRGALGLHRKEKRGCVQQAPNVNAVGVSLLGGTWVVISGVRRP